MQVVRVSRRRWRSVGKRRRVRLAHENRATRPQLADDRRVADADSPFIDRRPVLGRESTRLDDVLCTKRDTGQRTVAGRILRRNLDPGVNGGIERPNPLEA